MSEHLNKKVSCTGWQELVSVSNAISADLPLDLRKQFSDAFSDCLRRYGLQGAFERMNNRTVAQIVEEFDPDESLKPMEIGERDGVRFALYLSPNENDEAD